MTHNVDALAVNTVRMLSMDQINQAHSGHPGLPLGAAPMAYVLFTRHLKANPKNPDWIDRDRFILSAGHGSALLYSLLYLSGYGLTLDDLKHFRQLGSLTPGHPEYHHTPGVEVTTGPLGQGFANGVGMAMAEAHLAALYNQEGHDIINHYTYVLASDGDLMEGISSEAGSLAGHLKLGKLIVLYDSNKISLDGSTDMTFTESPAARFQAFGWQTLDVADGNDLDAIDEAIKEAKAETERPSFIEVHTHIGYGAPGQDTHKVHGSPLGADNTEILKQNLGWDYPPFTVPEEVQELFKAQVLEAGQAKEADWNARFEAYSQAQPALARQLQRAFEGRLPDHWAKDLPSYEPSSEGPATRQVSGQMIKAIYQALPEFWGGSSDLSSSNKTEAGLCGDFQAHSYEGRTIWYGVREFAMAAINNGIAAHGGSKIFGATFFVFSDYFRGAARLAALSGYPVVYATTHDSIAVGEDGPTHQPIEQLASWRALPGLDLIRPADANETRQAWIEAVEANDHPTLLVLSRQGLPILKETQDKAAEGVHRGAYVVSPAQGQAQGLLLATGSEVALAIQAQQQLAAKGIPVSVVSMPSFYRFDRQDEAYKESVLPSALRNRLSIEAGATFGWSKYIGLDGVSIGLDHFGCSGPGPEVLEELGFTVDHIVQTYMEHFA